MILGSSMSQLWDLGRAHFASSINKMGTIIAAPCRFNYISPHPHPPHFGPLLLHELPNTFVLIRSIVLVSGRGWPSGHSRVLRHSHCSEPREAPEE